jgi:hypothetical protein
MTFEDAVRSLWSQAHGRCGPMLHLSFADEGDGKIRVSAQHMGASHVHTSIVELDWLYNTRPSQIVVALKMRPPYTESVAGND